MTDPGLPYLLDTQQGQGRQQQRPQQQRRAAGAPPAPFQQQQKQQQQQQQPMLVMEPLPLPSGAPGGAAAAAAARDWGPSLGNLESARLALDALRGLIADAVFLDEDAYTNAATLQLYQQRLQAQQRRILHLEGEVEALRVEAGRQQDALVQQRAAVRAAEARIQEMQQELDNNAVVFDMHYSELLLKNEEIERLKTVIEGMGSAGG